ncbi:hypothetical protein NDU88_004815 [Pleurodeles waltl]|uniref:Uncharacterized protein n=1 Tax=Pleurodeles waltl TaxID=8319 RepID=A0AAV7W6A9_PLEWA|nr:hypothetical protein NDU88_004815 [Pleurodeles waltl]
MGEKIIDDKNYVVDSVIDEVVSIIPEFVVNCKRWFVTSGVTVSSGRTDILGVVISNGLDAEEAGIDDETLVIDEACPSVAMLLLMGLFVMVTLSLSLMRMSGNSAVLFVFLGVLS